uniref:LAM_G_DOMAIN domain-containing protein n=1 Tax=Syphacia muris TaxID=451379 RepID=A0A0N5AP13_9BILA
MCFARILLRHITTLMLIVPWCFAGPPPRPSEIFQPILPIIPPHCSKMIITKSTLSHAPGEDTVRTVVMNVHIGLQNTICFRIGNGSNYVSTDSRNLSQRSRSDGWLHTLTLIQLEQHHPISQQYVFAIPEVRTSCICDCNPTANVCSAGTHSLQPCNNTYFKNSVCYRTFHPSQSDAGCLPGSQSKLCCEINFSPYKNITYTAVRLEQPNTFAVFKYVAYDYTAGRWYEKDKKTIRVNIDGRTQSRFLDNRNRIQLGVSAMGKTTKQLESGMYFARSNPGGEMDELRKQKINEVNENNFDYLGWYRKDSTGRFVVRNGEVKMQKIHLAKVVNCREQKSRSYLDASHYVDRTDDEVDEKFVLEEPVDRVYPWIKSAQVHDGSSRQAVVIHSEGTNLEIILQMNDVDHNLSFYHDFSRLGDFTGTIIVDFKSNRYFNVTAYNATGILYGTVKKSIDRRSLDDFSFTTYIDSLRSANKTLIVPMPEMIGGGDRMICIRPDDGLPETETCRIVPFREDPLEINLLENTWREVGGYCPDCNKISVSGFLSNLNPLNWADGALSLSKLIMVTGDFLLYCFCIIVAYVIITRCLFPLTRCLLCPVTPPCCNSNFQKHRGCKHQEFI